MDLNDAKDWAIKRILDLTDKADTAEKLSRFNELLSDDMLDDEVIKGFFNRDLEYYGVNDRHFDEMFRDVFKKRKISDDEVTNWGYINLK